MTSNAEQQPVFDEALFNDDIFSAQSIHERERLIDEKRKMFEESETAEFKQHKEQMLKRLRESREAQLQPKSVRNEKSAKIEVIDNDNEEKQEEAPSTIVEEGWESDPTDTTESLASLTIKEEGEELDEDEILTEEEINQMIAEADEHKVQGNEYFRDSLWEAAIECYTKALAACPKTCAVRSVYLGNRAACWKNLSEHQKVVDDCTEALKFDDKYVKVILRRAEAYEQLEKLSEALEDYKTVVVLAPKTKVATDSVQRLPEQIRLKQERDKEEMIGKLKDVGNKFLGLFGMSLDNFEFKQDPNSKGYSVNVKN